MGGVDQPAHRGELAGAADGESGNRPVVAVVERREVPVSGLAFEADAGRAPGAWPTYWIRSPYWSLQKLGSGAGRGSSPSIAVAAAAPCRAAASQCSVRA